jgi:hypothetical protein
MFIVGGLIPCGSHLSEISDSSEQILQDIRA